MKKMTPHPENKRQQPWRRIVLLFSLSCFLMIGVSAMQFDRKPKGDPELQAEIGRKLFFDPILSLDSSISCASCHKPEFAFADNVALSPGVGDSLGRRNTPSVMNMAFRPYFFYDGRAETLEAQAVGPIENQLEMHQNFREAVVRVTRNRAYQQEFLKGFGALPDSVLVVAALAAFQRSLESDGSAPHDRWLNGEDDQALSAAQIRGREIFLFKGKCFDCHFGPDFTGDEFRNVGLYDGPASDAGRFEVTGDSADLGKFKVPGLRNVTLTAPYMHDGRFQTLEEVVDFYDDPSQFVTDPINMDTLLNDPLNLSDLEKSDLVAFMHSLTDANLPNQATFDPNK